MDAGTEIDRILKADGAMLERQSRHLVFTLSNGRRFVMSKTPSDVNARYNALRDLKTILGLNDPCRGEASARRPKAPPRRLGPATSKITPSLPRIKTAMGEKILAAGLVEHALRAQIEALEDAARKRAVWTETLRRQLAFAQIANARKRRHIKKLLREKPCWWHGVKRTLAKLRGEIMAEMGRLLAS